MSEKYVCFSNSIDFPQQIRRNEAFGIGTLGSRDLKKIGITIPG
jgi:hypothetical protein